MAIELCKKERVKRWIGQPMNRRGALNYVAGLAVAASALLLSGCTLDHTFSPVDDLPMLVPCAKRFVHQQEHFRARTGHYASADEIGVSQPCGPFYNTVTGARGDHFSMSVYPSGKDLWHQTSIFVDDTGRIHFEIHSRRATSDSLELSTETIDHFASVQHPLVR